MRTESGRCYNALRFIIATRRRTLERQGPETCSALPGVVIENERNWRQCWSSDRVSTCILFCFVSGTAITRQIIVEGLAGTRPAHGSLGTLP